MTPLYIGLMSGTSLDGVDAVAARFPTGAPLQVLAHHHMPMPEGLRHDLLALNSPGDNELHRGALAGNALALLYDRAIQALLQAAGLEANAIRAVGAHGQTVRHRPQEFDGTGYTLQLLNGALLAERCGLDVICDFRSRDLAAGGQGAPLVPAFHAACFARAGEGVAVLNLGGIGNLSLLSADGAVHGFDCGPGNVLLDLWCQRHTGQSFDADGAWASTGRVVPTLLADWLGEPFFARQPPKSTGRDLFHAGWLDASLLRHPPLPAADVQATLAELTVQAAVIALRRYAPGTQQLLLCGGGALNGHLMRRLGALLPGVAVQSTAEAGLPPLQVEATAFAWLAQCFIERRAGSLPTVTGARVPRVLGALYPRG
ncbi:anhydro-N-acetylmuramic acid kinase [Aquabacterium sp.]|uniref:anhydro-N-acetylmuramic acid kinase n=1 Tax=Aquabacterium sp. TaxID=1872578 RepID=UPI0037835DD6